MEDIEQIAPAEPLAAVSAEELLPEVEKGPEPSSADEAKIKAVLEAIIYVTEEPLTKAQIAAALGAPPEQVEKLLAELAAEYEKPEHGLAVREVAGGYKMATKAEHHEAVRAFVRSLKPAPSTRGAATSRPGAAARSAAGKAAKAADGAPAPTGSDRPTTAEAAPAPASPAAKKQLAPFG